MIVQHINVISSLKDFKLLLKKEFGRRFSRLILFGSYANSSNTEESDIDILVVLDHPIGWKFFSLEFFLESVFKKKIDLVTQNALKEQLKSQILKQVSFV